MNFIISIIKQIFDDFYIILLLIISILLAYVTNNILNKIGIENDNLFLFLFLSYFIGFFILRTKK